MTIRRAEPKDLNTVFEFRQSLCEEERGEQMDAYELLELMAEVAGSMKRGGPTILIAEEVGIPVGAIWCYGGPCFGKSSGFEMTVDMLYLIKPARRGDHLKDMWDSVHELADEYGITLIQGHVSAKNDLVYKMWMRRGARVRAYILEKDHPPVYVMPGEKKEENVIHE